MSILYLSNFYNLNVSVKNVIDRKKRSAELNISRLAFCATTQPAFTCSKLTIETPERGVKYVQS